MGNICQKKWCFVKKITPIYGSISVSLQKDYISNIDTFFNIVVKVDKKILEKFGFLDIVVKSKLIKI